jgi:hypothetical protein
MACMFVSLEGAIASRAGARTYLVVDGHGFYAKAHYFGRLRRFLSHRRWGGTEGRTVVKEWGRDCIEVRSAHTYSLYVRVYSMI